MYLIDTNYLIRIATEKDSEQSNIVFKFLSKCKENQENVKVSLVSVFEFLWILKKFYNWDEIDILNFLEKLYMSTMVEFENLEILLNAMSKSRQNLLGLEDNYNLILAVKENRSLHTFDKKLAKEYKNLCAG
jgi:predicted nucleic-acid-binding protein